LIVLPFSTFYFLLYTFHFLLYSTFIPSLSGLKTQYSIFEFFSSPYLGFAEKLAYLLIFTFILIFVTFFLDEKSNQKNQDFIKNAKICSITLKQTRPQICWKYKIIVWLKQCFVFNRYMEQSREYRDNAFFIRSNARQFKDCALFACILYTILNHNLLILKVLIVFQQPLFSPYFLIL
jgi:hypothetical protein